MRRPRLPRMVRFLLAHAAVGFGLSTLGTVAIVYGDPAGLGTLLVRAPGHPGPLLLLWFFLGLTLGGVQMAVAVMLSGGDDDDPGAGRRDAVPVDGGTLAAGRRALRAAAPSSRSARWTEFVGRTVMNRRLPAAE
jgi:hypothetical protein